MKLFYVRMHNDQPGVLLHDYTRSKASKRAKRMFGDGNVDEVVPISNQDAEAEFGDNYMQHARWNMLRSEDMDEVSVLTGDNPFLVEKMNMKKADMGDVIDDFYKSDAPQFDGKSKAKRRQMAIAAKLQANEEKKHVPISKVAEGIDQKVLKTFKDMMKTGEEDNVKLLLQGMPKHTKTMYMKRLGIKEDKIDGRTKSFRETVKRLNMAKNKVDETLDTNIFSMTEEELMEYKAGAEASQFKKGAYRAHLKKGSKTSYLSSAHYDSKEKAKAAAEVYKKNAHLGQNSLDRIMSNHEKQHAMKEDIEETPKKKFIQDPKLKNLKIPNPKVKRMTHDFYKGKSINDDVDEDAFTKKAVDSGKVKTGASKERIAAMQKQDDNRPTLRKETKEAPPGTYFTRSGQLKKGDPASDGKGGAKLASDPLDKQRKTIVNLKNYPK